jgi:anti-anti-sigma factor
MGDAEELAEILEPLLGEEGVVIAIDMSNVEFLGSRAIGVLLAANTEAKDSRSLLILANLQGPVAKIMRIAHVGPFFQIVKDLDYVVARREELLEEKKQWIEGQAKGRYA